MIPFSGYLEDVDGCERVEEKARAALERLLAAEALFVSYVQGDSRAAIVTDSERAEAIATAAAAASSIPRVLRRPGTTARGREHPLFELLLPLSINRPIVTGDDAGGFIEAAHKGH